jgi:octaprenyl-diphosphate synthase
MLHASVAPRLQSNSSYDTLLSYVHQELNQTNALIVKHLENRVVLIPQLAGHILSAGGKKVRPLLTLATTRLCGGDFSRAIPLAASIEFIHTATLLHDDVVDESSVRRGKPSANAIWGNSASVLVGDFLFGRSFELMVADGHLDVLKILSKVSSIIIEGEILQLTASYDFDQAEKHYFDIIRSKTGQLFSAGCEVGATVSDATLEQRQAMADYGMYVGMAFQCVDDLLDYFTDEKTMGKKPGDDFREGKITLPVLLAYKAALPTKKELWHQWFNSDDQSDETFLTVKAELEAMGVYKKVQDIALDYVGKAQHCLRLFPDSELKQAFVEFAEYCVLRAF